MYIFPLLSTAVSLVFAIMLGRQYAAKRRPFQLAWSAAMAMYGLASLAEAAGQISGWDNPAWNNPLIKTYYVFGALMVVGYLALGTLYIQKPKVASGLIAGGVVVAMSAVVPIVIFNETAGGGEKAAAGALFGLVFVILLAAAFKAREKLAEIWLLCLVSATVGGLALTALAPVDASELAKLAEGGAVPYEAIQRSLFLKGTVVALNVLGGFVLIGGALYSGWGLIRKSVRREQAIGMMLIGLGAVFPYFAGLLSGYFEAADQALKSIFLSLGIIIMFLGFLQTGRSSGPPPAEPPAEAKVEVRSA